MPEPMAPGNRGQLSNTGENVASFDFGTKKREVSFKFNDEVKKYSFDPGNAEVMERWQDGASEIVEAAQKFQAGGPGSIRLLIDTCKKSIELILPGEFDTLWELVEHNVYSLLAIAKALSDEINASRKDEAEKLGL